MVFGGFCGKRLVWPPEHLKHRSIHFVIDNVDNVMHLHFVSTDIEQDNQIAGHEIRNNFLVPLLFLKDFSQFGEPCVSRYYCEKEMSKGHRILW